MKKMYFVLIVFLLGVVIIIRIRVYMDRIEIMRDRGNIENIHMNSETAVIKVRGKDISEKDIEKNIDVLIDIEKILRDVKEKDLK